MAEEKASSEYMRELRRRAEEKLRAARPESGNHDDEELLKLVQELQIHHLGRRKMLLNVRRIRRTDAGVDLILLAIKGCDRPTDGWRVRAIF